jgi:creatinine amidohydrolase
MERAVKTELTKTPPFLPKAFLKTDGAPDVKFEGYEYFVFPMEHREFSDTGLIGNPFRATKEKGLEAYRRFAGHLVRALKELRRSRSRSKPGVRQPGLILSVRNRLGMESLSPFCPFR